MNAEIYGYKIENLNDTRPGHYGYHLIGKRGAIYGLMRNQHNPEYMFVINGNGNVCGIKGNYTFCDKNGKLESYCSM